MVVPETVLSPTRMMSPVPLALIVLAVEPPILVPIVISAFDPVDMVVAPPVKLIVPFPAKIIACPDVGEMEKLPPETTRDAVLPVPGPVMVSGLAPPPELMVNTLPDPRLVLMFAPLWKVTFGELIVTVPVEAEMVLVPVPNTIESPYPCALKLTVPVLPGLKLLVPLIVNVAPPLTPIVIVLVPPPRRKYDPVPDKVSGPKLWNVTGLPVVEDSTVPELATL